MELTTRQEQILKVIVEQYIAGAHPVGSAAVVGASGLGVSSATVRNEMSVLEELGYIRQLHTSGGRVPTKAGYRLYVERLMETAALAPSEARTIAHQFHQAHHEVQEWLKLAATVMAVRTRNVGLITAPRSAETRLRHLEVIAIQHSVALLILVLGDGTVLQEMVSLPEARPQEDLSASADRLSVAFKGLPRAQIEARSAELPSLESAVATEAIRMLRRAEEQHSQVFHAGLSDLIRQPEFLDPRPGESANEMNERLRNMVEFLHQGFAVQRLISELPGGAQLQIVIGGETSTAGLEDYSFVLGRYGNQDDSSGYLGVVGPTRLEYPRAVALVRYMTDLMTDLMQAY